MSWEEAKEEVVPEDREGSEPRRADTGCRCHSDLEREAALTWGEWRTVAGESAQLRPEPAGPEQMLLLKHLQE